MSTLTPKQENLVTVQVPQIPHNANAHLLGGTGAAMDPLDRLKTFSPEQFENFIAQWAFEYLGKKYVEVQRNGGAGDKGRDVVAWLDDDSNSARQWDNYQCKHYQAALAPSDFCLELGKLCHYTYVGDYTIPRKYYIATSRGIGAKLASLIKSPEELKKYLISNWKKYCEKGITDTKIISLYGKFKTYVENFDFSIIEALDQKVLIDQHSQTTYHRMIFGGPILKSRTIKTPPGNIDDSELPYIAEIYEAFAQKLMVSVKSPECFENNKGLSEIFKISRKSYYSAEALKEFSRDNYPTDSFFNNLKEDIYDSAIVLTFLAHSDGTERLIEIMAAITTVAIDSNALKTEIRPLDKQGICHHLANDGRLKWKI